MFSPPEHLYFGSENVDGSTLSSTLNSVVSSICTTFAWYAALRFDRRWRLGRVKGASIAEIGSLLATTVHGEAIREPVD